MVRYGFALAALLLAAPLTAHGQERVTFQFGAGLTPNIIQWYGTGAHLIGGISLWPGALPLGIRLDGVATIARHERFGILPGEDPDADLRIIDREYQSITGGSLSLAFRKRSGTTRPYGYAGIGYYESPWRDFHTWKHKLGPTFGLGISREVRGIDWFLELSARVFGNIFARDSDYLFAPLSVGIQF
jgi:hypothetical protein